MMFCLLVFGFGLKAQNVDSIQKTVSKPSTPVFTDGLKFNFNEKGSSFIKLNFVSQVWVRFNESNPGTMVDNTVKENTFDIGVRRLRFLLQGYLNERLYVFMQFGQNNLSYIADRKAGAFFHDANADYYVVPKKFALGTGLASWGGVARYSAPSIAGLLTMDAPIYQQFTNDINDIFLRRLSVYTHGTVNKFSYRLALSKPMDLAKAAASDYPGLQAYSTFAPQVSSLMTHGYFKYHFFEKDPEETGYHASTYWGKKKMLTVGAGFAYEPKAMWHRENVADTVYSSLQIFATDVFFEMPLSDKGNALNLYGAAFFNDYGQNYVRNVGVMNPANKVSSMGSFNGTGNAFPMQGTGQAYYLQATYIAKRDLLGKNGGTLAPYTQIYYGNYQRFKDPVVVYDVGINWAIQENKNKLSLNFQSRPIFDTDASNNLASTSRKAMWILQYQVAL